MEPGKRAPHTQTPPRSAMGQVPAFHLVALPRVCPWSCWSRLYGVWVPRSCSAVSLAPLDHLTRLCDSVCPTSSQVNGHPPQSSEGSWCPCLVRESLSYWQRTWWNRSLQPIWSQGFSALTSLCPRKVVGCNQSWVCASWTGRSASSDASVPKIGLQQSTWRTRTSMCRSFHGTGQSCGLRSKDRHISTRSCPSAVPITPCLHESSGGSPCSLERTGRAHSQLPSRLAHTAYALKLNLFVEGCSSHGEDPRKCQIRVVLSFMQQGLSPSILKVYVAVIATNHDPVEGKSVWKHDWVIRFLRGARRLNPPRPPLYPPGTCLQCSQHYSMACSSLCRQSSRSSKEKGKFMESNMPIIKNLCLQECGAMANERFSFGISKINNVSQKIF